MLRYRALLIDTEKSYARPVQQFFMDAEKAQHWAKRVLKGTSDTATVVLYRTIEEEMYSLSKADFDDKQGAHDKRGVNDKASATSIQEAPKASS